MTTPTPTPRTYPFECKNCGHKPTVQAVLTHHGDCEKCRDTVITYTVDSAKCIEQLEREVETLRIENAQEYKTLNTRNEQLRKAEHEVETLKSDNAWLKKCCELNAVVEKELANDSREKLIATIAQLREQLRQRDEQLKAANEDAERGWRWADNENSMDDTFEKDLADHRARTQPQPDESSDAGTGAGDK